MPRALLLPLVLGLTLSALGCAGTSPVIGSWELVEANGQPLHFVSAALRPVKILNETHFAFGSRTPEGRVWAGGGRYAWDDGLYTEIIGWHSVPELVGATAVFHDRVEAGLWHHEGDFQAGGKRFQISEVWRRVEGPEGPLSTTDPPAPPSP